MSFELILPFLRPIEPLLLDDSISEIMGNPDASWWYERDGILRQEATISFNVGQLRTGLEVIANQLGKKLDEDNPLLHAQLPDGSRLAAVIPPVARPAPALTIRKLAADCLLPTHPIAARKRTSNHAHSEHDWRGFCMRLPAGKTRRSLPPSPPRAGPISPILFTTLSGRLMLRRPGFGSSKVFRSTTL
jgi:hypothetical protein